MTETLAIPEVSHPSATPVQTWPPPYTLRQSAKAKHLQLQISLKKGLEIIVPKGRINPMHIETFLNAKKMWIIKHLYQNGIERKLALSTPQQLNFRAIGQHWKIHYTTDAGKSTWRRRNEGELNVMTTQDSMELKIKVLQSFIKRMAAYHLPGIIADVSKQTNLSYENVTVRYQKTRWGSCSHQQNINLNAKLLFLPSYLVHHVIKHELVHTIHLDHSARFWQRLQSVDPQAIQHDAELNQADKFIPGCLR